MTHPSVVNRLIPDFIRPYRYFAALARRRTGQKVMAGPFRDMRYVGFSVGSAYTPKLLGIYERELADTIERIVESKPSLIVDVGAAEGYYAVGLALRVPDSRVVAFETEPTGRQAVADMAHINGVSHQVTIKGTCEPDDLRQALANKDRACVIMDVEGYEATLLDPTIIPELGDAIVLVELHEFAVPDIRKTIEHRFRNTHDLELIWQERRSKADFPWRTLVTHLLPDRYTETAVSEMRPIRMCWYIAWPRG